MLAARILFLARTMRCAMVGSAVRNERAISGVCRPAMRRSVSATCASGDSDGWQHVKMSRSRSSSTGPTSSGSSSAWSSSAWAWRSSRVDSRRWRSTARLRAVVMIQATGLGGSPLDGHRSNAMTNASWTASSATSMSPKRRTREAMALPDSSRKTCSTCVASTATSRLLVRLERTDLDGAAAGDGRLAAPLEGGVEIRCLDHPEATDLLLRLGERTIGRRDAAAGAVDDGRRLGCLEATGEHPRAGLLQLGVDRVDGLEYLLPLRLGERSGIFGHVHREHVLGHRSVLLGSAGTMPASRTGHERRRPKSTGRPRFLSDEVAGAHDRAAGELAAAQEAAPRLGHVAARVAQRAAGLLPRRHRRVARHEEHAHVAGGDVLGAEEPLDRRAVRLLERRPGLRRQREELVPVTGRQLEPAVGEHAAGLERCDRRRPGRRPQALATLDAAVRTVGPADEEHALVVPPPDAADAAPGADDDTAGRGDAG